MKGFFASEKARIKVPSLSTRNSMPFKHLLGPEGDVDGRLPWRPVVVNFMYQKMIDCLIASIYI